MTIKADDRDLRVEAERTQYRLQTSNKPFDRVHEMKNENIKRKIGPERFQESIDYLRFAIYFFLMMSIILIIIC